MDKPLKERAKELSDSELFECISDKKSWAMDALYDRHAPRLNGLAFKVLNDDDLAEEVLQEIFIKVWESAHTFNKEKGSPLAWMMIMCRNRAIDKYRSRQSVRKHEVAWDESILFRDMKSKDVDPIKAIYNKDLQVQIKYAMSTLPAEQSLPIEMAFFQGYSQSEISEKLALPLGTVKTRMRLGMKKLRTQMIEVGYSSN